MTENLNPYDTNLLANIEARIKAERKSEEFKAELEQVFGDDFNPYDLNQVGIFNRLHRQYSSARADHSRRPSSTEKGLYKID